eukprot:356964-Chlamydomonas_euryale.AAC.2
MMVVAPNKREHASYKNCRRTPERGRRSREHLKAAAAGTHAVVPGYFSRRETSDRVQRLVEADLHTAYSGGRHTRACINDSLVATRPLRSKGGPSGSIFLAWWAPTQVGPPSLCMGTRDGCACASALGL